MVLLRPVAFGIDEQVTPVAPCFSDRTPGVALKNMAELHDRESVETLFAGAGLRTEEWIEDAGGRFALAVGVIDDRR